MEALDRLTEKCSGCGEAFINIFGDGKPCMDCVRARARTAGSGRCRCGRKANPGEPVTVGGYVVNGVKRGGRTFTPCKRCLGNI